MKRLGRTRTVLLLLAGAASLSLVLAAGLQNRTAYRYLNVFQEVWSLTRSNYVEPVDESALLEGAFRGMVGALDGASAYLAPGEEKPLASPPGPGRTGMETLPSGAGPVIVRVDPGGPAARAGLSVGDQIWKIGGKTARQEAWPQTKRRLSGAVGGHLDLVVLDAPTFKLKEVKVDLEAPKPDHFVLDRRDGPLVYLRLLDPEFIDAGALRRALSEKLASNPGVALLIDLRGVVSLDPAVGARLAGVFFPGAPALRIASRSGADDIVNAERGSKVDLPGRVFVLVDAGAAGVGEALAALLREKAGAVICGRTTYGLAGLPELVPLSRGGSVLIATRELRTPGGTAWAEKGLEPDKVLTPQPAKLAAAEEGRDLLLDEALHWIAGGAPLDKHAQQTRPGA